MMKVFMNGVEYVFLRVAALFFLVFVFCIILQVVSRYVPGISFLWAAEVATYAFIWTIFLGGAVMVRLREHFSIDFLFERLQGFRLLMVQIVSHVLVLGFGLVMVFHGTALTAQFWTWTVNTLPQLQQGFVWMALPVSGVAIIVFAAGNIMEDVQMYKGGSRQ
ncbi:TRAP-type C4-dicarboxylate transport system permease small subunit [Geomicrobium halophilum]|uniref:TRAP-type C4-dicarboxylate transport system permease small subunit n=2 Tax=Geomicrobium halophilum TaxID=549000 RepID=A0A841PUL2_9BACL|nr:TRAP-type C4-dicarboxylate transport system permease small subunit [Geomicrobium halophilum]